MALVHGCAKLTPGVQGQQHKQRADVKNKNAVDDLVHSLGDGHARIVGFRSGNAHEFKPAEGKGHNRQCGKHAFPSMMTLPLFLASISVSPAKFRVGTDDEAASAEHGKARHSSKARMSFFIVYPKF